MHLSSLVKELKMGILKELRTEREAPAVRKLGTRREIPVVLRKSGDKFIPSFPIELEPGDTLIIAREMMGSTVPEGERWTVSGYTSSGPVVTKHV